jgi:hypothetical protein
MCRTLIMFGCKNCKTEIGIAMKDLKRDEHVFCKECGNAMRECGSCSVCDMKEPNEDMGDMYDELMGYIHQKSPKISVPKH